MTVLHPGAHLWQVGLADAGSRVCDTLVAPVDAPALACLLAALATDWANMVWIPPTGYAHLTVAAVECRTVFTPDGVLNPATVRGLTLDVSTGYSVRLAIHDSGAVDSWCARFGLPARGQSYLTLGYATAETEVPDLSGYTDLVTAVTANTDLLLHRRFDHTCAVFQPAVLASYPCR